MITLDASIVIAHLSANDSHHRAATAFLRESAGDELIIHSLNLAEVLVGGARLGRSQEMLDDLVRLGIMVSDPQPGEALRLANLRVGSGLKLPDCCALDTALTTGSTLATFDIALATAARQRGLTVAPSPD